MCVHGWEGALCVCLCVCRGSEGFCAIVFLYLGAEGGWLCEVVCMCVCVCVCVHVCIHVCVSSVSECMLTCMFVYVQCHLLDVIMVG